VEKAFYIASLRRLSGEETGGVERNHIDMTEKPCQWQERRFRDTDRDRDRGEEESETFQ
jgi:hypothetical protein